MMYKHLTSEQRYAIYPGLQKGDSEKTIVDLIKVDRSTVSREKRRNSTANGKYVWVKAQADRRKHRTPGNRRIPDTLRWRVTELIKDGQWSPRQISGRLLRDGIHISHETIYGIIRGDGSGVLASCCRHGMKYRRKARHTHGTKARNIPNRVSIHERPAEADGRRFGDWEMDTIVDSRDHAILTLTDRSTNFPVMEKTRHGRMARPLAKAVWRLLLPYKGDALKTITTDNGCEFAGHEWITKMLDVPVHFADPYCAWQKGTIENGNKLVRQYIPKGTDLGAVTDGKIAKIRKKINLLSTF